MSYVRIRNASDKVNRLYLEKLGISTKRDDATSIGQFGSGAKFAPIAALRKGWQWAFSGHDDLGPYTMEYVVDKEGDIDSVFFSYDDGTMKPSSYTLGACELSWNDDFQIVREAIANALDEYFVNGAEYSIDVVDEISQTPEGFFDVYITATTKVLEVVENFDFYFCINRAPIFKEGNFSLYENKHGNMAVYNKGVLVYESDRSHTLFDYNFSNLPLNEERRLSTPYALHTHIAKALSVLPQELAEEVLIKFGCAQGSYYLEYELGTYDVPYEIPSSWRDAWNKVYGENAVPVPPNAMTIVSDVLSVTRYTPVSVGSEFWLKLFERAGIPLFKDVLDEDWEYDKIEVQGRLKSVLDRAIEIVVNYDDNLNDVPVHVFAPTEEQKNKRGVYFPSGKEIWINVDTLQVSLQETVATLVHELDHHVTGLEDDQTTAFRNAADTRIAELLLTMNGEVVD